MKVKITKTFEVREPVANVWDFLTDPRKVATCVPGAQITEAVDERRYIGTINVKVGPVVTNDKGELVIERMDAQNFEIELVGKGQDVKGKVSVSMKMVGKLRSLPQGGDRGRRQLRDYHDGSSSSVWLTRDRRDLQPDVRAVHPGHAEKRWGFGRLRD